MMGRRARWGVKEGSRGRKGEGFFRGWAGYRVSSLVRVEGLGLGRLRGEVNDGDRNIAAPCGDARPSGIGISSVFA